MYAGDINWNKNIEFLINVFSKLRINNPDLTLVLVGDSFINTTLKETLKINKLISTLSIEKNVIKTGFISVAKLKSLYLHAKVYVQPSLDEGFGLPVLEALTTGALVASSNNGSLPEAGGKASFYFNPKNENEAIQTIQSLLNLSKEKRNMYIKAGKDYAEQFSWEKNVRLLSKLFQSQF